MEHPKLPNTAGYLLLLLGLANHSNTAKVLILPINVRSHILFMSQIGIALAEEGHDVTVLIPQNAKVSFGNVSIEVLKYDTGVDIPFTDSAEVGKMIVQEALAESFWEWISIISTNEQIYNKAFENDCIHKFEGPIYAEVKARRFDIAISDGMDHLCGPVYPYSLGIPYVRVSVSFAAAFIYRVPALASFTPLNIMLFSDQMTFWQRILNLLLELMVDMAMSQGSVEFVKKYAPDKPAVKPVDLFGRAVLWFTLQDIAFNYPSPTMPNVIPIGSIMARPAQPLTADLLTFMDGSKDGVILVSLGSFFSHVPEETLQKFCQAFSAVNMKVIWKVNDVENCDLDRGKVKVMDWIPQNDILAHPNLKVFVTHGGLNSIMESIYHGKPMVALPLMGDQPYNAHIIRTKQLGIFLDFAKFTSEELVTGIEKVARDDVIRDKIQHASGVLRGKPESVGKKASFWINHVIKHGDQHLRTAAFKLNIFQFLMFDVFLTMCMFLICAFLFITAESVCLVRNVLRCYKRYKLQSSSRQKEKVQ